jgi:hypothetical protein
MAQVVRTPCARLGRSPLGKPQIAPAGNQSRRSPGNPGAAFGDSQRYRAAVRHRSPAVDAGAFLAVGAWNI